MYLFTANSALATIVVCSFVVIVMLGFSKNFDSLIVFFLLHISSLMSLEACFCVTFTSTLLFYLKSRVCTEVKLQL